VYIFSGAVIDVGSDRCSVIHTVLHRCEQQPAAQTCTSCIKTQLILRSSGAAAAALQLGLTVRVALLDIRVVGSIVQYNSKQRLLAKQSHYSSRCKHND
jgi:hypothetical protein